MSERMIGERLADVLTPLDGPAELVQKRVREVLRGVRPLRDAIDGAWLGSPLHPALTDVPVGAGATAFLLDLAESASGSTSLANAADRALAVSVLGALPAAVTGLGDWRGLRGTQRRMGLGHALLNVGALGLNAWSLVLRARGRRTLGKAASGGAFAVTSLAAHVGGELSFGLGVRVNRTAWEEAPDEFTAVLDVSESTDEALHRAELDGAPILVARARDGRACAIDQTAALTW